MGGPSARFALPDDERAPIDQRAVEPELELASDPLPVAPASAHTPVQHAEPLPVQAAPPAPPGKWLGMELQRAEIARHLGNLLLTFAEFDTAAGERRRGIAISALNRIIALCTRMVKDLERGS